MTVTKIDDTNREWKFKVAYDASYYTIIGCGGNIDEWTKGYTQLLEEAGIGKPVGFVTFKGKDMNLHYELTGDNAYPDDLTCLMFPLTGLDVGKLAIFKLKAGDRWFDDIVDNNARREAAKRI